ncbi:MAG: hypothetical protein JNM75_05720 [Rhodospirillales bacterium]|nr:hypothetical protein [Rhodospirillales bacterium]
MIAPRRARRIRLPRFADVRRSRYLTLLLAIAALLLLSPFLEASRRDRILYGVLTLVVLIAAVRASTQAGHRLRFIALGVGLIWALLTVIDVVRPGDAQRLAADGLFLAFSAYTMSAVLGRVLTAKRVDFDILCGTAAAYLLLTVTWAILYGIIETLSPGSFAGMTRTDFPEFLYFSLTTVTSLGFGDITPINPFARVWVGLQAVVGIFYMAAVVARLVSAYER